MNFLAIVPLLGVCVSILIYFAGKIKGFNNLYLSLYFLFVSINLIIQYNLTFSNNNLLISILYRNFTPLILLPGPFFYFYIRKIVFEQRFSFKKDYIHFLPAFIELICLLPWYFTNLSIKKDMAWYILQDRNNVFNNEIFHFIIPPAISMAFRPVLGFVYVLFSLVISVKYYERINVKGKNIIYRFSNWVILLIAFQFLIFLFYLLNSLIAIANKDLSLGVSSNGIGLYFVFTQEVFFVLYSLAIIILPLITYKINRGKIIQLDS